MTIYASSFFIEEKRGWDKGLRKCLPKKVFICLVKKRRVKWSILEGRVHIYAIRDVVCDGSWKEMFQSQFNFEQPSAAMKETSSLFHGG